MFRLSIALYHFNIVSLITVIVGTEEELGSSEESGKDWDELEEEARKGMVTSLHEQ